MDEQFTVDDGIKVQANNLAKWKSVLKASVYKRLEARCTEMNSRELRNGYDVFRGCDLDSYIYSLMTPPKK